jgi:hypothetical protein
MAGMAGIFTTVVSGGGGNIPAGAAVMTDSFGPLKISYQETNSTQSDSVSFTLSFPETNAAQSDAVSFQLRFPESNALPTDSFGPITLGYQDTSLAQSDTATFTLKANYADTNSAQSDTNNQLTIKGYADTNATVSEIVSATATYLTSGAGAFTTPTTAVYTFSLIGGGQGGAAGSTTNGGTGGNSGDFVTVTQTIAGNTTLNFNIGATSATAGIGNNTTLTLPGGGGSTTSVSLVDSSGNGLTLSKSGTVTPVTSSYSGFNGQAQFTAGASNNLNLAGASAAIFSPANRSRTYECRLTTSSAFAVTDIMGNWSGNVGVAAAEWLLALDASGNLIFSVISSINTTDSVTIKTLAVNTSYIIRVVIDKVGSGGNYFFVDGVLLATNTSNIPNTTVSATSFSINTPDVTNNYTPQAFSIDEVRISSGARSTAAYTVDSSPFAPDASTLALYHLDTVTTGGGTSVIAKGGSNATASTGGTITAGGVGTAGALLAAGGNGGNAPNGGTGGTGTTAAGNPGNPPGGGGGGGGGSVLSPGAGSTGASGKLSVMWRLV